MKLGTTLQAENLPDHRWMTTELVLKPQPETTYFFRWQFVTLFIYTTLGGWFRDWLPIPLPLIPVWAVVCLLWPIIPAFFALQFFKHYAAICTASLSPEERIEARAAYRRTAFARLFLLPVMFPWSIVCIAMHPEELYRAWFHWFTYNRQRLDAPGVLVSPAGPQPVRVWMFRICVFLTVAASLDVGLVLPAVTSLLIAPSLGSLKEARRV